MVKKGTKKGTKKAKGSTISKCSRSVRARNPVVEEVSNPIPVAEPTVHSLSVSDGSECEGQSASASSQEKQPTQPLEMYFDNSQFTKICKIQTKCFVKDTVKLIKNLKPEVNWFTEHSQFHHFFHMPEEPNLKLMGMWMLLLRTIRIEEENIAWFGVNGVPIRYSMREHALISGLDCHEYPKRYLKLGSYKFVDAHFENRGKITIKDVEQKLLSMKACSDRLKMAVLFFLGRLIRGKAKDNGPLDPFILRIVDRLDVCETFPWGRLTFEDAIKGIKHMMNLLNGKPKPTTGFAGFIIPLEMLAFECIPSLAQKFRIACPVDDRFKECPRMCKSRFTPSSMKGYPLEDIYAALGKTKVIHSMLLPTVDEEIMLARIIDVEEEYEREGSQSDTWNYWLNVRGKTIWWEEMYELDTAARKFEKKKNKGKEKEVEASSSCADLDLESLKGLEEKIIKSMEESFAGFKVQVETKLDSMDRKLSGMKKTQRYLKRKARKLDKRVTALESEGNEENAQGEGEAVEKENGEKNRGKTVEEEKTEEKDKGKDAGDSNDDENKGYEDMDFDQWGSLNYDRVEAVVDEQEQQDDADGEEQEQQDDEEQEIDEEEAQKRVDEDLAWRKLGSETGSEEKSSSTPRGRRKADAARRVETIPIDLWLRLRSVGSEEGKEKDAEQEPEIEKEAEQEPEIEKEAEQEPEKEKEPEQEPEKEKKSEQEPEKEKEPEQEPENEKEPEHEPEKCAEMEVEETVKEAVETEQLGVETEAQQQPEKCVETGAEKEVVEAENSTEKPAEKVVEEASRSVGQRKRGVKIMAVKYGVPRSVTLEKTRAKAMAKKRAQIEKAAKNDDTDDAATKRGGPREKKKSKYLQSPFTGGKTEGKNEDIEGPTKKRKTNAQ